MTTMKSLCVIFLAVAFPHSTVLARAFEDQFGRTMEADLISHTGISSDIIKISMGGKQLDVEINLFSDKDQKFIRNWMKETPPKIDYAFRVEATLKQLAPFQKKLPPAVVPPAVVPPAVVPPARPRPRPTSTRSI